MTDVLFTSDFHFSHEKIFQFCPETRNHFGTIKQMDEQLIDIWNEGIKPGDIMYFLGDFSYNRDREANEKIFNALKGQKVLIKGNHDGKEIRRLKWHEVLDYKELNIAGSKIILFHYPCWEWNGFFRQSIHLYGHVHGRKVLPENWKQLDVGIDGKFQKPIHIDEIMEYMKDKENEKT